MKSIINETPIEKEIKAPCLLKVLGESKDREYIIFVTKVTTDFYEGFVVHAGSLSAYANKPGYFSSWWEKCFYELFDGTISLSN